MSCGALFLGVFLRGILNLKQARTDAVRSAPLSPGDHIAAAVTEVFDSLADTERS